MSDTQTILKNRLNKLYQNQKLAHFHIVQTDQNPAQTDSFIHLLSKELIGTNEQDSGHPDVLILSPDDKRYTIEQPSFKEYMRSWEFRPTNLKYRFFIFKDAHLLSDVILNKMLKQLEEPPVWSCILFFNPSGKPLLQTIESRSIKWQLAPTDIPKWDQSSGNFSQWLKCYIEHFSSTELLQEMNITAEVLATTFFSAIKGEPWDLFELVKSHPKFEPALLKVSIEFAQYKIDGYQELENFISEFQDIHSSLQFHNSRNSRLERLLNLWQKCLFATPRQINA